MAYFIVIYVICAIYMTLNFKFDLQMFQQNSYRLDRYWKWLRPNIGSAWRLVDVACLFLLMAPTLLDFRLSLFLIALVSLAKIFMILRRKSKKPLVMTRRVWRLYGLTALMSLGGTVAIAICTFGKYVGIYSGAAVTVGFMMAVEHIFLGCHDVCTSASHTCREVDTARLYQRCKTHSALHA